MARRSTASSLLAGAAVALALLPALAPAPASAPAAAGRFLTAVGDVALLRNARVIPAVNGTPVDVGDQVRTGPASSAQIRFSDSSIIAVKPQSLFTVSEYSFGGKEDGSEKALFNVIQGGLRTVTGLIGRINKRNYEVRTPTSTVGIRGTFWEMVHCGACTLPNGQQAPQGTYYVVSDGTINVSNDGGSFDFGPHSSVFVADARTGALRLVDAPPFVRDKLLTSGSGGTRGSTDNGAGTLSSSAGSGSPALTPAVIAPVVNQQYVASNNTNADGSSAILGATSAFTGFIAIYTVGSAGAFDGVSSCSNPPCNSNEATSFTFSGNQLVAYSGAPSGAKLISGGTLANVQTLTLSTGDVLVLGQLTGSYGGVSNGGSSFSGPNAFVFGATNSPLVNIDSPLPASGSFAFGGSPGSFGLLAVDAAGNVTTSGTVSGSFNAASRSVSFGGTMNFASIAGFGPASFSLGGGGTLGSTSDSLRNASLSWSCSGAGCQNISGSGAFDAHFLHSSTNIPAMVVDGGLVNATRNATTGNTVVFGAGLKCVSGAC